MFSGQRLVICHTTISVNLRSIRRSGEGCSASLTLTTALLENTDMHANGRGTKAGATAQGVASTSSLSVNYSLSNTSSRLGKSERRVGEELAVTRPRSALEPHPSCNLTSGPPLGHALRDADFLCG
jgi:hypothetical protein